MEIKKLKDLKEALNDIPNDILDDFGAGVFEDEHIELLYWGDEAEEKYSKYIKQYPVLEDIGKWIENIAMSQEKFINEDELVTDEPISSEDKIEINPKKD